MMRRNCKRLLPSGRCLAFDLDTYRLLVKRLTGTGLRSREVLHLGGHPVSAA